MTNFVVSMAGEAYDAGDQEVQIENPGVNIGLLISVLIATRNRARLLASTLLSLCNQTLSRSRWEVVIVDNGSQDCTSDVLSDFMDRLPLTVLYEPVPGKCRALNRATQAARGGILAFTDDDVEVSDAWLEEIYRASSKWVTDQIFCGPIHPIYPPGTPWWLKGPPYASYAYGRFELSAPEGPVGKLPFGANFAVRVKGLERIQFSAEVGPSGQNYRIGGETELLRRLTSRGLRVIYVPSCSVSHFVDARQITSRWLYKRSFCYGRGMQYLFGCRKGRGLFLGFPRTVIVSLQHAIIEFALSAFRGKRARHEAGSQLAFLFGMLYERGLTTRQ